MMKEYGEEPIKVPRFEESAGFYTTKQRSQIMAKIRGKNTKPELIFRQRLFELGFRYRVDFKGLPGRPDISNKSKKIAIFIDGEFWHGYNWEVKKQKIKANRDFWIPKIERNMQRDRENVKKLENMGFKVFRFWEHEVKKNLEGCISLVQDYLETV